MLDPWIDRNRLEAGCDEAGRGCLAGPVTAAAVVLQPEFAQQLVQEGHLNDSKKMTKAKREALLPAAGKGVARACSSPVPAQGGLREPLLQNA